MGRRHPADPDQAEQGHVELGGGEGCPPVAEFTAEPLGAALQISTHAAQQLLADALDHERRPESRQPPQSPAARTPRHAASHATAPAGHRYGMTTTPQDPDTVEPEIVPSTDPVIPDPMPGEDPGVPDTQPDPMP